MTSLQGDRAPTAVTDNNRAAEDSPTIAEHGGDVHVRIAPPPASLASYVTFAYVVQTRRPVSDFLYPEWGNVRFSLSGDMVAEMPGYEPGPQLATLFGPTDRAAAIRTTGGRIAGFGLTPLGWARLIPYPAGPLVNRTQPLRDEFGVSAASFHEQLISAADDDAVFERLEAVLLSALGRAPAVRPVSRRLDETLRTEPRDVASFASLMGMSLRTLQRECERLFGFSPKRLLRRQRFLSTLGEIRVHPDAKFAQLLDERYFDQSHFIRDFRAAMGMSPPPISTDAPRYLQRRRRRAAKQRYNAIVQASLSARLLSPAEMQRVSNAGPVASSVQPDRPLDLNAVEGDALIQIWSQLNRYAAISQGFRPEFFRCVRTENRANPNVGQR